MEDTVVIVWVTLAPYPPSPKCHYCPPRFDNAGWFNTAISFVSNEHYYASRLNDEPAEGVNDRHFHPVEPRNFASR